MISHALADARDDPVMAIPRALGLAARVLLVRDQHLSTARAIELVERLAGDH